MWSVLYFVHPTPDGILQYWLNSSLVSHTSSAVSAVYPAPLPHRRAIASCAGPQNRCIAGALSSAWHLSAHSEVGYRQGGRGKGRGEGKRGGFMGVCIYTEKTCPIYRNISP